MIIQCDPKAVPHGLLQKETFGDFQGTVKTYMNLKSSWLETYGGFQHNFHGFPTMKSLDK